MPAGFFYGLISRQRLAGVVGVVGAEDLEAVGEVGLDVDVGGVVVDGVSFIGVECEVVEFPSVVVVEVDEFVGGGSDAVVGWDFVPGFGGGEVVVDSVAG